jgi:hypothetical protein
MAYTRVYQTGFEMNATEEWTEDVAQGIAVSPTVVASDERTGTYAQRHASDTIAAGGTFTAATALRVHVGIKHSGLFTVGLGVKANIIGLLSNSGKRHNVVWDRDSGEIRLFIDSAQVVAVSAAAPPDFTTTGSYLEAGVIFESGASGFCTVYIDGVQKLTYSGDTGDSIVGVFAGGRFDSSNSWASNAHIDDFYIETSPGGEVDAPPPSEFLDWSPVNGAGDSTQLTLVGGASNWEAVDDTTPDDDTTHVFADGAGQRDQYHTTNITVPVGLAIKAASPTVLAKRTNAAVDSRLALGTDDGTTERLGSGLLLSTAYGIVFERQPLDPDSNSWTETKLNSSQIIVEGSGSF